jgi:hypothetical protein
MEKLVSQSSRKSNRLSQPTSDINKYYYLIKYKDERKYGVVEEKYVRVVDKSNCIVQMCGKKFGAQIIHFGLKDKCEEKTKKLEAKLSIDSDLERKKRAQTSISSDDEGTPRKKPKSLSNFHSNGSLNRYEPSQDADGDDEEDGNVVACGSSDVGAYSSNLSPLKTPIPIAKVTEREATTTKKNKIKRKLNLFNNQDSDCNDDCIDDCGDDGDDSDDGDDVDQVKKEKKKKGNVVLRALKAFRDDVVKTIQSTQVQR